jgi:hypothetical protein
VDAELQRLYFDSYNGCMCCCLPAIDCYNCYSRPWVSDILCVFQRAYPKPLCILFFDTKGIQWAGTDATVPKDVFWKGPPLQWWVFLLGITTGVKGHGVVVGTAVALVVGTAVASLGAE